MFIIHITKTHLFSFMKSFLILIASFSLAFNAHAAEKSLSFRKICPKDLNQEMLLLVHLVETCVACHGTDGNSMNTDWPKLAGQNEKYLYEQLKYFKSGERNNALMMTVTPYLKSLDDKGLLDIAAFYSSKSQLEVKQKMMQKCLSLEPNYIVLEILKNKFRHVLHAILYTETVIIWLIILRLQGNKLDIWSRR